MAKKDDSPINLADAHWYLAAAIAMALLGVSDVVKAATCQRHPHTCSPDIDDGASLWTGTSTNSATTSSTVTGATPWGSSWGSSWDHSWGKS